jgi:hypothetical protein
MVYIRQVADGIVVVINRPTILQTLSILEGSDVFLWLRIYLFSHFQ